MRRASLVTLVLFGCILAGASFARAATVYGPYNGGNDATGPVGGTPDPEKPGVGSVAVDQSNGNVYAINFSLQEIVAFGRQQVQLPHIGGSESPAGSFDFTNPSSITVDNTGGPNDGNILVADSGHDVVDIFNEAGIYLGQLTGSATPAGSFSGPAGIAFDSSGNLYVSDRGNNVIDKFAIGGTAVADGDYVSQFTAPQITSLGAIAFDGDDNLYVANFRKDFVKFNSAGTYLGTIGPHGDTGEVRVDPVNQWAFFTSGSRDFVTTLDGSPIWPAAIPSDPVLLPDPLVYPAVDLEGIAEDATTKLLYAGATSLYFRESGISVASPTFNLPDATTVGVSSITGNSAKLSGVINDGGGGKTTCQFEYGAASEGRNVACVPFGPFNDNADHPVTSELTGLTPDTTYNFRLTGGNPVGNNSGDTLTFTTPIAVHDLNTEPATAIGVHGATLNGAFTGDGKDTTYYFEWGKSQSTENQIFAPPPHYGNFTPEPPGSDAGTAMGPVSLQTPLTGLQPATTYHFRVIAVNAVGKTTGADREFTTQPSAPVAKLVAGAVHSESAEFLVDVNPLGAQTTFHVEYGAADCASSTCVESADVNAGLGTSLRAFKVKADHLDPSTTYHFRVVAENSVGTTESTDQTLTTFPYLSLSADPCPNAQVRKQTGAAQLLDCRAFELVSAASAGGYDVESDLAVNQSPYDGPTEVTDPPRILYSVHNGAIPGAGTPTNFTIDPYVAVRGPDGWETRYVGFPADGLVANNGPFGSPLAGVDGNLTALAFGGEGLCSPCFPDGSTGIPIRLPDGSLIQGMAGSKDPGPSAAPAGEVRKHFSADGSHFVFGSSSQFDQDGNSGGDVSIYDRALPGGPTHVVSKTPGGTTMTGAGISELDISRDGTRIVIGQKLGVDVGGNDLYHLYVNIGDSSKTIDLTPGAAKGAIYGGMSADGSQVYFATADPLNGDSDASIDLYRADVGSSSMNLTRVSTGTSGTGDTDACSPDSNWNGGGCDVLAIAGGGGIAEGDGSAYFLSPESLDGSGAQGKPNLFLSRPGQSPHFIATLSTDDALVKHAASQSAIRSPGDLQVARDGGFVAFASSLPLTGFKNDGFAEVFRFDVAGGDLDCVSCALTNVIPTSDAYLPTHGLGLISDGRVFFSSGEELAPGDSNETKNDAYEWNNGTVQLISSGISPFDSGVYSVSPDGADVYFFTRETLVRTDLNGELMKIYDARAGGGFLLNPPPVPCQASDECHGPSSAAAPSPSIGTYLGTGGNTVREKQSHKKRHHKKHRHKQRRHKSRGEK
jgi:hypothetical protein